jgi:hypothetical protein
MFEDENPGSSHVPIDQDKIDVKNGEETMAVLKRIPKV